MTHTSAPPLSRRAFLTLLSVGCGASFGIRAPARSADAAAKTATPPTMAQVTYRPVWQDVLRIDPNFAPHEQASIASLLDWYCHTNDGRRCLLNIWRHTGPVTITQIEALEKGYPSFHSALFLRSEQAILINADLCSQLCFPTCNTVPVAGYKVRPNGGVAFIDLRRALLHELQHAREPYRRLRYHPLTNCIEDLDSNASPSSFNNAAFSRAYTSLRPQDMDALRQHGGSIDLHDLMPQEAPVHTAFPNLPVSTRNRLITAGNLLGIELQRLTERAVINKTNFIISGTREPSGQRPPIRYIPDPSDPEAQRVPSIFEPDAPGYPKACDPAPDRDTFFALYNMHTGGAVGPARALCNEAALPAGARIPAWEAYRRGAFNTPSHDRHTLTQPTGGMGGHRSRYRQQQKPSPDNAHQR